MPKFLTSSTLFYSGIFAAAATWDAGAKKQRREQWEKAIAEARNELGQAAEALGRHAEHANAEVKYVAASREQTVAWQPDLFADVEPLRTKPTWPTNTGPELKIHRLPPESIYATGERKQRAELRRWTPKKLETIMLSVDALQLEIFLEVQAERNQGWREQASSAVPVSYRDKMFLSYTELRAALDGKIQDIKAICDEDFSLREWKRSSSDIALCSYRQDDQGYFHDTVRQLNSSVQDLFRQHKAQTIGTPSLLAKLAYNLSISQAPPNVHTYNTLILGLSTARQHRLVHQTIQSLRETHVRPNEITNIAALDHYRITDSVKGFVYWVELMRGKHSGQALARPDIRINLAGANRLIRVEREGYPDKVIQLPYPTPNVLAAMIKGVIKFSGFETALGICEGMSQEGWGLCMGGLTPLLLDCADRGAWDHGMAVWRQIQTLKARSRTRLASGSWSIEHVPLDAYAAMIRLCSKAGQKSVFQDIWDLAMKDHRQAARALTEVVKSQDQTLQTKNQPTSNAATLSAIERGKAAEIPSEESPNSEHEFEKEAISEADVSRVAGPKSGPSVEDEPDNQALQMPTHQTANSDESASRNILRRPPKQPTLTLEQLDGHLPHDDLDAYELRERPMTMYG